MWDHLGQSVPCCAECVIPRATWISPAEGQRADVGVPRAGLQCSPSLIKNLITEAQEANNYLASWRNCFSAPLHRPISIHQTIFPDVEDSKALPYLLSGAVRCRSPRTWSGWGKCSSAGDRTANRCHGTGGVGSTLLSLLHRPVPTGSTANPCDHCTILSPLAAYRLGGISCPKGTLTLIQPSKGGWGSHPTRQEPHSAPAGRQSGGCPPPGSFGCSL